MHESVMFILIFFDIYILVYLSDRQQEGTERAYCRISSWRY